MKNFILTAITILFLAACGNKAENYDASGTFEADEVVVSSEIGGKILSFEVQEGAQLHKDSAVGFVDATGINLQKEQVEASIQSLGAKTMDVSPQIKLLEDQLAVQESQYQNLLHEKQRIENLVKADAATKKQLDDITNQIDVATKQMQVTSQQIAVQKNAVRTQNRG